MGGWNRSRYVTGHRDRSAGASRPPRPPPPPDYEDGHYPVPLWEREFCRHVGDITWERFCENKQYVGPFHKHEPWDDSEAFDCFQNAKARFWANYHGKPSDIPLLDDPDLYIDKVDHQCKLDPELVAELDSVGLPFEDDNSAPATGWANAGADNKCTQNGSGNWDVFIEKPAEVNKWDYEANLAPNTTWGGQANVVTPEAVWGGQSSNKWGNNSNTSWGAPLEKPSWRDCSKNHYTPNNWNNFHGGPSNNRYRQPEDPSYTSGSGRKRNGSGGGGGGGGGYFKQRSNEQRNQAGPAAEERQLAARPKRKEQAVASGAHQSSLKWSGLLISWRELQVSSFEQSAGKVVPVNRCLFELYAAAAALPQLRPQFTSGGLV